MEYGILGPLTVKRSDGTVPSLSAGQRVLLAMLLLGAGQVLSTDRLMDELWGDRPPTDAAAALRNQMSRLRRLIAASPDDLAAGGGGYRLRLRRSQLDATRFEDLLSCARNKDGEAALEQLDQALALWRGRALVEVADRPFAAPAAVRIEELRQGPREQRGELLLALGRSAEAVADLEALVAEQPPRERARGLLMEALYQQGRHTEALATYQAWRRTLAEDLGLDPSPALQRLESEILRHTLRTVEIPAHVPPPHSLGSPRHNLPVPLSPFVGRGAELEELKRLLQDCRLLTLTGVGGAGKTRLALELAARVLSEFCDGVFLVELAALNDAGLVAPQVAAALDMNVHGIEGRSAVVPELCRYLELRRVLLLLDNCEHLVGAAAELAETILGRCPAS